VATVVVLETDRGEVACRRLAPLLALAFLVRLDGLALWFPALLVLGFDSFREGSSARELLRRLLMLSAFLVPTMALYLVLNWLWFGVALPTSGLAKALHGPTGRNWGAALQFVDGIRGYAPLLLPLLVLEWKARRLAQASGRFYRSMVVVGGAACIQALYYGSRSTWGVWPWYLYLAFLLVALCLARIVHLSSVLMELPRARVGAICIAAPVHVLVCVAGLWLARGLLLPEHDQALRTLLGQRPAQALRGVSSNQVSMNMLGTLFHDAGHSVVAMGDRAGGLAYWGRGKLSVVQTEGITEDIEFVRALGKGLGESQLERRFAVDYMVVDREVVPRVREGGVFKEYVVAEPIQARVGTRVGMTLCFPGSAVRYHAQYEDAGVRNERIAFDFSARVACTRPAQKLISNVARTQGLRQLSHPAEYLRGNVPTRAKRIEDADREGRFWSWRDILFTR
jgi:hypothetical protein